MNLARIEKLRKDLYSSAAYLFTARLDVNYFSGIDLEGFWLFVTKTRVIYISSSLLVSQLRAMDSDAEVIEASNYYKTLNKIAAECGIKNVLTDLSRVSILAKKSFSPKITLKHTNIANLLRMIKDSDEIAKLRASAKLAVSCVNQIIKNMKPGMTEEQICFKIEEYFARNMARISFTPIVASGPNSANPHHICSPRKIEKNDIITLDLGCIFNGYASDLTRTVFLGRITKLQKRVFGLVKRAKEAAQRNIRENVRVNTIDSIARKVISGGGFGSSFVHSTGHGIGLEVHEPPRLSKLDKTILKSGMCVTVEPGIYLPGKFGVRLEDSVVVTIDGCEVLTR